MVRKKKIGKRFDVVDDVSRRTFKFPSLSILRFSNTLKFIKMLGFILSPAYPQATPLRPGQWQSPTDLLKSPPDTVPAADRRRGCAAGDDPSAVVVQHVGLKMARKTILKYHKVS